MKAFNETNPEVGPIEFASDDWIAADTLAKSLAFSDFVTGDALLDGTGTPSQMRLSRTLKTSQGVADLLLVYSTVLHRIKASTFSGLLTDARAALGRRTYKHSNPFALVAEASLGIDRSEASRKGTILQAAIREQVAPKKLGKFIKKLGGLGSAYNAARAMLNRPSKEVNKPSNQRLSVILPHGLDLRTLIECGDEITLAVKPQKGGSIVTALSYEPIAVTFLKRLAQPRKKTSNEMASSKDDEWFQ